MKKLLWGCAALAVIMAGPVTAADMNAPVYTKAPIMAPAYSWTGLYIGVNAGGAWGDSEVATSTVFSPIGYFATSSVPAIATAGAQTVDTTGFTGGGQIGYNWQTGNVVAGVEADFEYLGLRGSVTSGAVYPCCAPTAFSINQSVKTDWLATFRARLGFLVTPATLVYVTGGGAVTNLNANFVFTDTFATAAESASFDSTKLGWTVGGGFEWAMWSGWSAKAEYLFVSFPSVTVTSTNLTAFGPPISFPTNVFTHSADLDVSIARVGLNYKIGGH
jgi:outer membrane immunogenic protein